MRGRDSPSDWRTVQPLLQFSLGLLAVSLLGRLDALARAILRSKRTFEHGVEVCR